MNGEGGDDIMVGSKGGQVDRFLGGSGFDWASFQGDQLAANVDLNLRAFDETPVPLSIASALARFEFDRRPVRVGAQRHPARRRRGRHHHHRSPAPRAALLTNFALILGLQALVDGLLGPGQTSFAAGNIILGGAGSDIIEGRGGDDLIDGDHCAQRAHQRARGLDRDADGNLILGGEIDSVTSMTELVDRVFSGEINPGQLQIVREILPDNAGLRLRYGGVLRRSHRRGSRRHPWKRRRRSAIQLRHQRRRDQPAALLPTASTTATCYRHQPHRRRWRRRRRDAWAGRHRPLLHIERLQFADQTIVLREA